MTKCTIKTKKGMVKTIEQATPKKLQAALRAVRLAKDETIELLMQGGNRVKNS